MSLFFSVIIPTYQRRALLETCLRALAQQTFDKSQFEVIVVNDSADVHTEEDQIQCWERLFPGGFKFLLQEHSGAAAARNKAIQSSRGRFVAMIDDDCQPQKNWLESFFRAIESRRFIIGWGGTVLSTRPRSLVQGYIAFKELLREPCRDPGGRIVNIVTANACYARSALAKIGGFRMDFVAQSVPSGGEDVDLTYRIGKLGPLAYCPEAVVYHYHRDTLQGLVTQHIMYGRGTYLACRLNNIPCEGLKFYKPTLINSMRYVVYVIKRIFVVSIPEFRRKKLPLRFYPLYAALDAVRKLSFLLGAFQYHHFLRFGAKRDSVHT
jgi:GT2 family glycosyltransferase